MEILRSVWLYFAQTLLEAPPASFASSQRSRTPLQYSAWYVVFLVRGEELREVGDGGSSARVEASKDLTNELSRIASPSPLKAEHGSVGHLAFGSRCLEAG